MKKHSFGLIIFFALMTLLSPQCPATGTEQQKPMNVLFLVIDDLNTWLLSDPDRYTGKVIAPNIARLAKSGVTFTRAYAASPKCSPSRTALLSGVAPWKSGVTENGLCVDETPALVGKVSLPQLFKEHGYFTASFGKISHGYGVAEWDEHTSHKRDPVPPGAPLKGYGSTKKITENDWGPTHLKEAEMNDTKYADLAVEQLQKKHSKPFFIACGMFHPHKPWYVPQKYLDMYPLNKIVTPVVNLEDADDIPEA